MTLGPDPRIAEFEFIENLPFNRQRVVDSKARIGLVVLASDYTIEHEFRETLNAIDSSGIALFHARIANAPNITPKTLAAMGPTVTETAHRLLPGDELDVLAYGCTSASFVLGSDVVHAMLNEAKPRAETTNPASAAFAALRAVNAKRIAVLTPYRRDVNMHVLTGLTNTGFDVRAFGSFSEEMDPVVAEIDSESIASALRQLTADEDVDAAFVSCTSIRMMSAIEDLETDLGITVISSNQAIIWNCLRLAGVSEKPGGLGQLFKL